MAPPKEALADVRDRVLRWLGRHRQTVFFVLLVFLFAFGIRAHLMRYELPFGFDSYFHARVVGKLLEDGALPEKDWLAYYQKEGTALPQNSKFFWYFTAFLYKFFTLGAAYDKALWIGFVKFLPALFGALTAAAMFFLGKEMYGKKAGIAMAFFAAVVPSFVYRTMAGFFEDDSLGFLWMVLGLVFLVKAVKPMQWNRQTVKYAVIAAFFFSLMSLTWEMFLLVPLVLASYGFWTLVILWFKNEDKERLFDFVKIFALVFVLFSVVGTVGDGGQWIQRAQAYVSAYAPVSVENIERAQVKPTDSVLGFTVGEENQGYHYFGTKFNALIVFAFLALFLAPYRMLREKRDNISLIIFFWVAITLYMAWMKLKFTYTFGLPIAASAGLVTAEIFYFLKGRTPLEKKVVCVSLAFMCLLGVGAATYFVSQNRPSIDLFVGWKDALKWMQANTSEDAKFFNWWDEGHWITFLAERRVTVDNRNNDFEADRAFAQLFLTQSEEQAYELVKKYNADYVVLSNDLLTKEPSLGLYAYNTTDYNDPRISSLFGNAVVCHKVDNGKAYQCGSNNRLTVEQMNNLPIEWQSRPNQLYNNRMPIFVYTDKYNAFVYFLNAPVNASMGARLWFNDPSLKRFEEVYENPGVKIFKVK